MAWHRSGRPGRSEPPIDSAPVSRRLRAAAVLVLLLAACTASVTSDGTAPSGTPPGADGIPTNADGSFSVCVPDKFQNGICVPPYVTRSDNQDGGPHTHAASLRDVAGGKM